jgi:hypothetical protein
MNLYLMVCEEQRESAVRFMWRTNRSASMVWVLKRAFDLFRSVTTKAAAAFRADDGWESLRFHRREAIIKQRSELKAKTVLERKKVNSKIMETELKSSLNKNANVSHLS